MSTWFERLFGFAETSYMETQRRFSVRGTKLLSNANGREFEMGVFETPTLDALRLAADGTRPGRLRVTHEAVGDVLELHAQSDNAGAMFQVASQFNCLEFPGPNAIPENGVTGYAGDLTQGPACALAAAAATVYRNYFVPVRGEPGQTADRQLNNLDALQAQLGGPGEFFEVRNGYTFSTEARLQAFRESMAAHDRETLLGAIKIGVQRGVQVTFKERFVEPQGSPSVSQAFCSAISCGYAGLSPDSWEPLSTLVLDAAYEATLLAAVTGTGDRRAIVWLTFLGGGVFGNRSSWISGAIGRALARCAHIDLDVRIAHYKQINRAMQTAVDAAVANSDLG